MPPSGDSVAMSTRSYDERMVVTGLERVLSDTLEHHGFQRVRSFCWARSAAPLDHWIRFEAQRGSRIPVWCVYDPVASPILWGEPAKRRGDTSHGVILWASERLRFADRQDPDIGRLIDAANQAASQLGDLAERARLVAYLLEDSNFLAVPDEAGTAPYDFLMPNSALLRRFAAGLVAGASGDADTATPLLREYFENAGGGRSMVIRNRRVGATELLARLNVDL